MRAFYGSGFHFSVRVLRKNYACHARSSIHILIRLYYGKEQGSFASQAWLGLNSQVLKTQRGKQKSKYSALLIVLARSGMSTENDNQRERRTLSTKAHVN